LTDDVHARRIEGVRVETQLVAGPYGTWRHTEGRWDELAGLVDVETFARVIRFRHVLRLLHAGQGSLSDVALEAGLCDQPHLNAEFKELSGFTPTEFLAALRYSPTSLAES